jgi:hypothetical protein
MIQGFNRNAQGEKFDLRESLEQTEKSDLNECDGTMQCGRYSNYYWLALTKDIV